MSSNVSEPVYVGEYPAMYRGDVRDLYLDISGDLVTGEAVYTVAFTLTNSSGNEQAGAVGSYSASSGRIDFRITLPSTPGRYTLLIAATIDDGQVISHTATVNVV